MTVFQLRVVAGRPSSFSRKAFGLPGDFPTTRLTLGLRRTEDRKTGEDPLGGVAPPAGSSVSTGAYTKDVRFNNTSYRVGVDHDLAKDVMAFGTLAVLGVQGSLRMNADIAKQRSEAVRIAQELIEQRRAYDAIQVNPRTPPTG